MDISTFREVVKESNGSAVNPVFIPSLDKTVSCKQMTVGVRKTLSKAAISVVYGDVAEFDAAISAIFTTHILDEDFNIDKLTVSDQVAIACQLLRGNITEDIKMALTCTKCKLEFDYIVDIDGIVSK